jgi:hypothetical protein
LRKRARLDLDADEDAGLFSFLRHGHGGPASTSTPKHPPNSPAGFFTAGRRAPTPLARTTADADLPLDGDESELQRATTQPSAVAAQLSTRAAAPIEGAPRTPSSATAGPSTDSVSARNAFFNGLRAPLPLTPVPSLPFPLIPTTSSNAAPPESPRNSTFRAGGSRERDDTYNPYSTPQRGAGGRHRTGITPTRGFKLETVPESTGPEVD